MSSLSSSDDFVNQVASIQLPPSLFGVVNTSIVGLVSTFYESDVLFPLADGSRNNTEIRTSVIGVLLSGVPALRDLPDPVEINLLLTIGSVSKVGCISLHVHVMDCLHRMRWLLMQHV